MKKTEQNIELLSQQVEARIAEVFGEKAIFFLYIREPGGEEYSLSTNAMDSRSDLWEINNFTFEALEDPNASTTESL